MSIIAKVSAAYFLCILCSPPEGGIRINIYNQIIRHSPQISSHTQVHIQLRTSGLESQ